jgi:hypothetical protein
VQVKLEYGSTLRVYSAKRWSEVCPRYRGIPPQSPVYVPRKDRQLVCQHVNNLSGGYSRQSEDHNEQGIKPETCQGYREQVFRKMTEDLEWIRDPRSSVENANDGIP